MNHLTIEGVDASRTPEAETLHTARLAIAAVTATGALCMLLLAACLLQ